MIFQKEMKHDALGWTHRPPESRCHVFFLAAAPGSVGVMFFFLAEPGRQPRRHVFLFCRPAAGLLDDEGFLKDFAFGRPSAGPASWLTGQNLGVMFFSWRARLAVGVMFFLGSQPSQPRRHVFLFGSQPGRPRCHVSFLAVK